MPVGQSSFPGQVDVAKNFGFAANNAASTLAASIEADTLAITLADASRFPSSGFLTLDLLPSARTATSSEIVYYDGKSGSTLTLIARGQDGTTAKAWLAGSVVEARGVAKHHNLIAETLVAVETEVLSKANTSHNHVIGDVSSLQGALDGKAASGHTHAISDTTGLQAALDAKAASGHTHTIGNVMGLQAALDAKLPLAGGTMTGALTLSGAPASSLHAATKGYVDTAVNEAASGTGAINVTNAPYSALGDGRECLDGAMTSGSAVLTSASASFSPSDVGKLIHVDGAGATGAFGSISGSPARAPLVTTIAGYTNSTTVTLAANAQATGSSIRFVYGSDDTEALQAALDDAALLPCGGSVVFPPRIYFISTSLSIRRPAGALHTPSGSGVYGSVRVSGYGAWLISGTTSPIHFLQILPTTLEAIYYYPVIEGFSFEGIADPDSIAISLWYTFGAIVRDCRARRIGVGVELEFCLAARVTNFIVDYFSKYGFYLKSAVVPSPGGGGVNNCTILDHVNAVPCSLGEAGFFIADDQVVVRDAIVEQLTETQGTAYIADFIIDNTPTLGNYQHGIHIDNVYSEYTICQTAMFKIINDGYVVLSHIRRLNSPGGISVKPLVDATGSTASSIACRDWTLLGPSGPGPANSWIRFKQNAANSVGWIFENMGEISRGETTNLVTNSALWVGGVIPSRITQIEPGRIESAS